MTTPSTLSLLVNGDPLSLPGDASQRAPLTALLTHLELSEVRGVAIAINDRVVPRSTWHAHMLADHDRIEIIRATQGG